MGKMAATAVAAMSCLAQKGDHGPLLSSGEIAKRRNLSKPLVAKILTVLSQQQLVRGSPGPGGGYQLARPANEINLLEIVKLFENPRTEKCCPYGPNWCGEEDPCPLHDDLVAMFGYFENYLRSTTLTAFRGQSVTDNRDDADSLSSSGL